jgi:hypothetical protein
MQAMLLGLGGLLCLIGIALIVANVVLNYMGLSASYNFGDPAKFEFILVPFWQIGLATAAIGAAFLWAVRGRS